MDIKDLGQELKEMTVADIASKTNKTERYVKAHLTRNGIYCLDYNGAVRKAAALKRLEEEKTNSKVLEREGAVSVIPTYISIAENKKQSDSLFASISLAYGVIWLVLSIWGFKVNGGGFFLFWMLMSFGFFMANMMTWASLSDSAEKRSLEMMSESQRASYLKVKASERETFNRIRESAMARDRYGLVNENLICPHCQTKGQVRTKSVEEITKTKVVPIIGNNIKSRRGVTQAHCDNCKITWSI